MFKMYESLLGKVARSKTFLQPNDNSITAQKEMEKKKMKVAHFISSFNQSQWLDSHKGKGLLYLL